MEEDEQTPKKVQACYLYLILRESRLLRARHSFLLFAIFFNQIIVGTIEGRSKQEEAFRGC